MSAPRVLFALKRREDFSLDPASYSATGVSSGLYNSASLVAEMLQTEGIEARVQVLEDYNKIDREVTRYKPTHVIIEALWVIPTKFDVLTRLHPRVKWVVRVHSHTPFLANEGIAINWLMEYFKYPNVYISANDDRMVNELKLIYQQLGYGAPYVDTKVIYLPNFYNLKDSKNGKRIDKTKNTISVGCFGAVRPLKNQLLQAIAAVEFAVNLDKKLNFQINVGRLEQNGNSVYNNIRSMFDGLSTAGHTLTERLWTTHDQFLSAVGSVDIGMQVSMTETFNIVAADFIHEGVPVVTSNEVPWVSSWWVADPNDKNDMVEKLHRTYNHSSFNAWMNRNNLRHYVNGARDEWLNFLNKKRKVRPSGFIYSAILGTRI